MNKMPPTIGRSALVQDCNSMLISALCNLTALVVLGLITTVGDDGWRGIKLMAEAGDGLSSLATDVEIDENIKLEATAEPATAMGPMRLFDESVVATSHFGSLESLSENSAMQSGFDGFDSGTFGNGSGASGHAATKFFGIGGYGQTFVYVVDASGSMSEEGKFERACYELLQSIEQLSSDQRYFVIFYNNTAYPMDEDEPVLATPNQFRQTLRWIDEAVPNGGTNPLPALNLALSLRPDAIYFLSDGLFDPVTVNLVRMQNRPSKRKQVRQIPIHTVAFVDRSAIGLMRTIARDSQGEHRFVK
jgi:hypothetical protein